MVFSASDDGPLHSQRQVLRILAIGFGLVVLLLVTAAWVGYQGSESITQNARALLGDPVVVAGQTKALEARIEEHSRQMLDRLELVLGISLLLAVGCSALTIWITKVAFERLEWQASEMRMMSWHMLQTQEEVARRFSHEMHDELGQSLTGLKAILKRVSAAEFEKHRQDCLGLLEETLTGVRELSQLLRPVILDDFGLDAGLRWLLDRFRERTQLEVTYDSNYEGRLTDDQETHLFRIAQEALTNVARHSRAKSALVRLRVTTDDVSLWVEDDGVGMHNRSEAVRPSLGMVGMRARARQLGGDLEVTNRREGGVRIRAVVPRETRGDATKQEDTNPVG